MMLYLVSLTDFHAYVDLFLAIVPCQLLIVRSCSGNIGYVVLVCRVRLLVIGMLGLRVLFGRS